MMDNDESKSTLVHHVKFYKPHVRAIFCMAACDDSPLLALSRSDCTVEIWNIASSPYLTKSIASTTNSTIECLRWAGSRLFSCGSSGFIFEYNLFEESAEQATSVTGGAAWCIDYCPVNNLIACGTEEGFINILAVTEDATLEHVKYLDKQQGRVLCLSWEKKLGEYLATSSSDVIRVFHLSTGHAVHKMTTGRSHAHRETIVWSLCFTSDFTVISGDSRGYVTFWDGKLGTQIESIHSHQADVVSIAVSSDETTVYASGVDPIIVEFGRVSEAATRSSNVREEATLLEKQRQRQRVEGVHRRWAKGGVRRVHEHDVRALAISLNVDAQKGLFSGGLDGYLTYVNYRPKQLVRIPPFYKGECVQVLTDSKWLLLRYLTHLEVHRLGRAMESGGGNGNSSENIPLLTEKPKFMLKLETNAGEMIETASIIAHNGSNTSGYVVYSTFNRVRFYRVDFECSGGGIKKLSDTNQQQQQQQQIPSCKLLRLFQRQGKTLCVAASKRQNHILLMEICDEKVNLLQQLAYSEHAGMSDGIGLMSVSREGHLLAVADYAGNVRVWHLNTLLQLTNMCLLPRRQVPATALSFNPDESSLFIAYSDLKLTEYNLEKRAYTDFSRMLSSQPQPFWHTAITGIIFDPHRRPHPAVIAYDDASLCVFKMNEFVDDGSVAKLKKKVESGEVHHDAKQFRKPVFYVVKSYKHIIAADWLKNNQQLVIVVVDPLSLMEGLPPILEKKRFGR